MTILLLIIIMSSTIIFQDITEKLEKMTHFNFTILGLLIPPKVLYATHW